MPLFTLLLTLIERCKKATTKSGIQGGVGNHYLIFMSKDYRLEIEYDTQFNDILLSVYNNKGYVIYKINDSQSFDQLEHTVSTLLLDK